MFSSGRVLAEMLVMIFARDAEYLIIVKIKGFMIALLLFFPSFHCNLVTPASSTPLVLALRLNDAPFCI